MIILRLFSNKANRASKKAWEKAEARNTGNKIFKNIGIDLSPNDELRVFRLKQVADVHGGVGDVIHPTDPSKNFRVASDAVLNKERTINHKINSRSFKKHSDRPSGKVKYGEDLIINDLAPWRNKERYEILRTGGKTNGRKAVVEENAKKKLVKNLKDAGSRVVKTKEGKAILIGVPLVVAGTIAGAKAIKKKKAKKEDK